MLCGKLASGNLTIGDYTAAIKQFEAAMRDILPPPGGDKSLIRRASQINEGYGCSRSADGIYIALTEQMEQITPTALLTFDQDLPKQAAKQAPSVKVHVL